MFENIPDPASGQTVDEIEAHLRAAIVGSEVAIRDTHGGCLRYRIGRVTGLGRGRLYTDVAGAMGGQGWYVTTGKHTLYPKGQSRAFVPTEAIRAFIVEHPQGLSMHYRPWGPGDETTKQREAREAKDARGDQRLIRELRRDPDDAEAARLADMIEGKDIG